MSYEGLEEPCSVSQAAHRQMPGRAEGTSFKALSSSVFFRGLSQIPPCTRASQCSPLAFPASSPHSHTFDFQPCFLPSKPQPHTIHYTLAWKSYQLQKTRKGLKLMLILIHLQTCSEFTFSRPPRLSTFPAALISLLSQYPGKGCGPLHPGNASPTPLPRPGSSLHFLKNLSRCFLFTQSFPCQFDSSRELLETRPAFQLRL